MSKEQLLKKIEEQGYASFTNPEIKRAKRLLNLERIKEYNAQASTEK